MTLELSGEILLQKAPHFYLRLAALAKLTGVWPPDRAPTWSDFTRLSADVVALERPRGDYDPYDLSLDIPMFYLRFKTAGRRPTRSMRSRATVAARCHIG